MQIEDIEYNALMIAIERYRDDLDNNDSGIDPFNNEQEYTTEMLKKALHNIEDKIRHTYLNTYE